MELINALNERRRSDMNTIEPLSCVVGLIIGFFLVLVIYAAIKKNRSGALRSTPQQPVTSRPVSDHPETAPADSKYGFCTQCGGRIAEGDGFCSSCGAAC
jgi:hypothetical protein